MKFILKLTAIIATTFTLILGLISFINPVITFAAVRNCIWVSVAFWMLYIIVKCWMDSVDLMDKLGGVLMHIAAFISGFLIVTGFLKLFNLFSLTTLTFKTCFIVGGIILFAALLLSFVRDSIYAKDWLAVRKKQ